DDRVERAVANYLEDVAGGVAGLTLASGTLVVAGIVAALLLVFALISIAAALLRYHGYELRLEGRTLRSTGGLLTRHEQALEPGKIQMLIQRQSVVQRCQKRFRVTVRQAVAGRRERGGRMFTIPTITASRADYFRRIVLAPEAGRLSQDPHGRFTPVSRHYLRGRILFLGLLPALATVALLWMPAGPVALVALTWFPLVVAGAWQSWRRTGYQVDADELVRRSGLIGFRTAGILLRKVQRVTISRSRYQRRHALASLKLYTAAGSVRIPYIGHDTARQLRDYVLYRVESSDKAWH
ncbi:MAG: PH domain-containing protein, partial [Woeseiaceae bacterium]|nr:PH domain-containing protein [Woeseiaceae bacterium]